MAGVAGLGGGGGFLAGGGGGFLAGGGGGGGDLAGGGLLLPMITSNRLVLMSPTVSAPNSGVSSAHSNMYVPVESRTVSMLTTGVCDVQRAHWHGNKAVA